MKENNKQVIFYSAEKDGFLKSYKDRGNLVFAATFTDRLRDALYLPVDERWYQSTTRIFGEVTEREVAGG